MNQKLKFYLFSKSNSDYMQKINDELKQRFIQMRSEGHTYNEIAFECGSHLSTVFHVLNNEPINPMPSIYWKPEHVAFLIDNYGVMTTREIAWKLGKNIQVVYNKAQELVLKIYNPDPPKIKIKHHPPIYTNIQSPYGIGSALHADGRIFV